MAEWDTMYFWNRLRMRPELHQTMNSQKETTVLNLMSEAMGVCDEYF